MLASVRGGNGTARGAVIEGRVVRGKGEAAGFTALDWVRSQLIERLGIDPYPGTLNLRLETTTSRALRDSLLSEPGIGIDPPDPSFCRARCYPMRLQGLPAAAVVPEVAGYPSDTLELVAAVGMRDALELAEGASIAAEVVAPLAVRAVIFDVDGTMLDSLPAFYEVARLAAEPHGYAVTLEQVRLALATNQSFWSDVVPAHLPNRHELMRSMARAAGQEWSRVVREFGRLHDGLEATLATLAARGLKLGIVTGARADVIELLRDHQVADRFEVIVTAGDVATRKPDPEGIRLCLERLGVAPAEAVYVGDAPIDIEASHAAGVSSIGVLTGAGDSASLTHCRPHRLMGSIAGVPAAVRAL